MTGKVVFRRAARAEYEAAALWYEERRPGLGAQFVSEVDRVIALVARQPERFPVRYKGIRCVHVRRFPYTVYFQSQDDRTVVLAVFHVRRAPMIWQASRS